MHAHFLLSQSTHLNKSNVGIYLVSGSWLPAGDNCDKLHRGGISPHGSYSLWRPVLRVLSKISTNRNTSFVGVCQAGKSLREWSPKYFGSWVLFAPFSPLVELEAAPLLSPWSLREIVTGHHSPFPRWGSTGRCHRSI